MTAKRTVKCDYCKARAELVTGDVIYPHRPDLAKLKFWRCVPCEAWVGVHKGGTMRDKPLGRLANKELRRAKHDAHEVFDPLWKDGLLARGAAYHALAVELGILVKECHIGMFDVPMCERVPAAVEAIKRRLGRRQT